MLLNWRWKRRGGLVGRTRRCCFAGSCRLRRGWELVLLVRWRLVDCFSGLRGCLGLGFGGGPWLLLGSHRSRGCFGLLRSLFSCLFNLIRFIAIWSIKIDPMCRRLRVVRGLFLKDQRLVRKVYRSHKLLLHLEMVY